MKTKMIIILTILFVIFSFVCVNNCFAAGKGNEVEAMFTRASDKSAGIDNGMNEAESASENIIGTFISVFGIIGSGIALVVLIILAGQFILGSVEQKAEVKKHLVPYCIGIFVFFSATTLLSIIHKFISGNW